MAGTPDHKHKIKLLSLGRVLKVLKTNCWKYLRPLFFYPEMEVLHNPIRIPMQLVSLGKSQASCWNSMNARQAIANTEKKRL